MGTCSQTPLAKCALYSLPVRKLRMFSHHCHVSWDIFVTTQFCNWKSHTNFRSIEDATLFFITSDEGVHGCIALSDVCLTTRFSFQIAFYLLVKQKEILTLHKMSLRALFHAPLQIWRKNFCVIFLGYLTIIAFQLQWSHIHFRKCGVAKSSCNNVVNVLL